MRRSSSAHDAVLLYIIVAFRFVGVIARERAGMECIFERARPFTKATSIGRSQSLRETFEGAPRPRATETMASVAYINVLAKA